MLLSLTYVGVGSTAQNFDFVRLLGESLNLKVGTWAAPAFWFTGVVVLLSPNLTVVDMIGRIVADILKTNWLRASQTWTESRLYLTIVWLMVMFGSVILLAGVNQQLLLLVIASALNGLVNFVYSVLHLKLNRGQKGTAAGRERGG